MEGFGEAQIVSDLVKACVTQHKVLSVHQCIAQVIVLGRSLPQVGVEMALKMV